MADVKFTLMLTVCLVVMVIFLFLRNVPATIIPSLALPLSMVGTFAVMYSMGFSLDNISLMALTLSVGFVRGRRHRHAGKRGAPHGARQAPHGSRDGRLAGNRLHHRVHDHLAGRSVHPGPVHGGVVGRLFHEFAVTISSAILISGFVSLSLTPMLCRIILKPGRAREHGRAYLFMERFFDAMRNAYSRTLGLGPCDATPW